MNNKKTILVVDDEQNIRALLKEILEEENFNVEVAEGGLQARELFYKKSFDLVLLDVWMPDVDGITLLREFSKDNTTCSFIMMSGHGTVDTAIQATKLGAKAFLEKPISLQHLLDTVRYYLNISIVKNIEGAVSRSIPVSLVGKEKNTLDFVSSINERVDNGDHFMLYGSNYYEWDALKNYINNRLENIECIELNYHNIRINSDALVPQNRNQKVKKGLFLILEGTGLLFDVYELKKLLNTLSSFYERVILLLKYKDEKIFSNDIYPRLNNLAILPKIEIPKLKYQVKDIPEKASHYIEIKASERNIPFTPLESKQINYLINHVWPYDYLEFTLLLDQYLSTGLLSITAVHSEITNTLIKLDDKVLASNFKEARDQFEKTYLRIQLMRFNGKISIMAKHIEVERTYLYRKLKALGIKYK